MSAPDYVHGYSDREARRLLDQAASVRDLLHHDTAYPDGSLVLEPACGIGAQTVTLASSGPGARYVSFDVAAGSLARAARRTAHLDHVHLLRADLFQPPFPSATFDHLFVCHLLEHMREPVAALRGLAALVRGGGTVTVIEGDHGSCYFHPSTPEARAAWRCLIRVQAELGGDSLIGRRLYPVLSDAGLADPVVSPRMVYADASRPGVMDAFVARTIVPMVEGVRQEALARKMMAEEEWERGLADLRAIQHAGDGAFCYTFFKAVAEVSDASA